MPELFARAAKGVVDAQLMLDDLGRDSFDAFDDTGVPPTVLTWSAVRVSLTASVTVAGKQAAEERTSVSAIPGGPVRLSVTLRYLLSPQGGDDPAPAPTTAFLRSAPDPDTG
jgi:hypothetical protein